MKGNFNKIYNTDARNIDKVIKKPIIDVTITSPPYFDLKDYGYPEQIGYGQQYEQYLEDLKKVFKGVYNCTKDTGTLWVIIDAYRRDGEVVPLPFDFSNKIKSIGWKLQEVIIWGKDRTLPWAHKGQMRNLFEYIMVFSKTNNYHFFIDEIRDVETLKKWWVKYPERYNPRGKTPDAIWHFDIPTQGSWGDGHISHFCPLPEEMIAQILKLTTKEGDVVLDPFAGSGAVLAKADNMKRKYIGTELNEQYIKMFQKYQEKTADEKRQSYENRKNISLAQDEFRSLIINLRVLKYGRLFYKSLIDEKIDEIGKIYVEISDDIPIQQKSIVVVKYFILLRHGSSEALVRETISEKVKKPPLSKFGIEPIFSFTSNIDTFVESIGRGNLFIYTDKITHKFKKQFNLPDITALTKNEIIISKVNVNLDEKAYE